MSIASRRSDDARAASEAITCANLLRRRTSVGAPRRAGILGAVRLAVISLLLVALAAGLWADETRDGQAAPRPAPAPAPPAGAASGPTRLLERSSPDRAPEQSRGYARGGARSRGRAGPGPGAATPSRVSSAHSPAARATSRRLMAARRTFASMAATTRAPHGARGRSRFAPVIADLAARATSERRLAIDTEFVSERRYRALLCLVQVAVPDPAGPTGCAPR